MHEKALAAGADEVVFDLEDAVAADAKAAAREQLLATLSKPEWAGRAVAIRVNAPGSSEQAADLALWAQLDGVRPSVVIPKVESIADIVVPQDGVAVQALIETPAGLAAAPQIAAHGAVVALILGYADLAAALGRRGADEWLVQQEALLAAARIGGAQAIDGPFFGLRDQRGVLAAARHARRLGFDGKWAIHPAQVPALNALFTPSEEEVAHARAVIAALEEAEGAGAGAVALDGQMLDEAVRVAALRVLARAGAATG
jgi:citrate lyase subunit beta/citryl-CoA lyase